MRILQVSHDFLPGHRAGAEIYTYNLCRELAKRHKIHLLFTEYKPTMPQYSRRDSVFVGLTYTEVINNHCQKRFEETYNNPHMDEIFRSVLDSFKPDVIHFQHLLYHSTNYPRIASEAGIPTVMTLHDFWPLCEQEGKRVRAYFPGETHDNAAWKRERFGCMKLCDEIVAGDCAMCWNRGPTLAGGLERAGGLALRAARRLLGLDLTAMARRHYERLRSGGTPPEASPPKGPLTAADITRRNDYIRDAFAHVFRFICPSSFLAKEMRKHGYPAGKLLTRDYGFKTEAFDGFRRTVDDRIRFGFIGTPAELKGVHVLVKAFAELNGEKAALEIFGDTQTFPQYTSWLRELAGDARVTFHGRFEPEAVAEVFAQIDVLVVPSIWFENSPLVIHEAFMSRTPVITSNLGGMADLVEDGKTGLLFRPGDAEDLAAKMRRLLENTSLIAQIGDSSPGVRTIAEDALSAERLYEEALSERCA